MRIAIVTETFLPSTDGVVTRLVKAVDYFLDQGHEVLVIAPDLGVSEYKGARVVGMPARTLPVYRSRPWSLPTRKVRQVLKNFKPDIVHAANPILLAASGALAAYKLNIPLITSYHTNLSHYLNYYRSLKFLDGVLWAFNRWVYQLAPLTLVTSNAMRNQLVAHGINSVQVLPRGIDNENRDSQFFSPEMRERLSDGNPNAPLLIFVGRVAKEKEIERLEPLMRKRDDLRLAIVGDGPDMNSLQALFKGTNTVFTGFMSGRELSEAYASADFFMFPSVSETLGLVILESMASGVPVIAADSAPTREQIVPRQTGMIWDSTKKDSLEQTLDTLIANEDLRQKITRNALKVASENSWEKASQALLEAYEEVIVHEKSEDAIHGRSRTKQEHATSYE